MSNLFDIVNVNFGNSKAEQPDEKSPKKPAVAYGYGQVSALLDLGTAAVGGAVNPVIVHSSPKKKSDSIGVVSLLSGSESEQIPEIDQLKQFTIPKKRKAKKELLEPIRLDSREFQHDVLPAIQQSFKSRSATKNFTFLQAKLVHNAEIFSQYVERRKQMRQDGYSDKDAQDNQAFLCLDRMADVKEICLNGLKTGHSKVTSLGNPKMGVYLSRHADIVRTNPFHPGFKGILVIFKVMKGKLKLIPESASNVALEPTPNFDCHMSKAVAADVSSMTQQHAFESTQMYLYEYGELDLEERPRQICPYAVVQFSHTGEQQTYRRPPASKTSGKKSKPHAPKSSQAAATQRNAFLSRQHSASLPDPVSAGGDCVNDCVADRDNDCVNEQPATPIVTAESSKKPEPRRVGESADSDGGGVIVWEGNVTTRGCVLCTAELVSYGSGVKPGRIGHQMPLDCGQSLAKLQAKCFHRLTTMDREEEMIMDNKYYTYGELRPTNSTQSKFNQVMTFLARRQIGIIIKCPDSVLLVMLTNCEITQNLGLSEPNINPMVLHCFFVSPTSRVTQLQGRINTQPTGEISSLNPTSRDSVSLTPNIQLDSSLDEDFRKFVPLSSLLYRDTLSVNFDVQSNVQDQHNIDIARGIIMPGGIPKTLDMLPITPTMVPISPGRLSMNPALLQGAPQSVSSETAFEQGMDPRLAAPHASPTSSRSLPELAGSAHYHHLSPAQHSLGPAAGHQTHVVDQHMRDAEFSPIHGHGQYNEPVVYDSGQMDVSHGHGYSPVGQHRRHSGYDEQHAAMRSHPSPDLHHQQQWPSTQQTYQHTLHARHASMDSHPNARHQVRDPRLLGSLRSSVDDAPSSRPAPFLPGNAGRYAAGNTAGNASSATTIQTQNFAERLSVGSSLSPGTKVVLPQATTNSSSLTRLSTGSICGTAPTKRPHPTERRIRGDDDEGVVETATTGSVDGNDAATATKSKSNRLDGFRLNLNNVAAVNCDDDDMSDDLADQIIRGCTMNARRKLNVVAKPTDNHPKLNVALSIDSHPVLTPPNDSRPAPITARAADFETSEQLSKTTRKISEETQKIKTLEETVKAQTLPQNFEDVPSSEPCPSIVAVNASTVESTTSAVAACPTSGAATETAAPKQNSSKSDSTHKNHRSSNQTKVKRLHASRKEKPRDKKTVSKKGKSEIRTADDMKLFLNRARKRDSKGTRRTVVHKIVQPHTSNGVKKTKLDCLKRTNHSDPDRNKRTEHLDFLKNLVADMKLSTCASKKSKSSSHAAARVCSNAGGVAVLSANQSQNIGNTMADLKLRHGNSVVGGGQSMAGKICSEDPILSSNSTTIVIEDSGVSSDSSLHKDTVSSGGFKFPDSVVQTPTKQVSLLTVCLRNDGTGDGTVGFIQNNDSAVVDGMDQDSCDIMEISSPLHETVADCDIPDIPTASTVTANTDRPPLTQTPIEIVHQKAVSFLNAVKSHLFSPVLASDGLDPYNRFMFDGSTVHVGSAIDDIAVTFTWEPADLDPDLDLINKPEIDESLEQCLFEAMHRYEDSESDAPQTETEREMTDLWHIGLHYLLPIIDWLHLHDRTVTETREREREGKENAAPIPDANQTPDTSEVAAEALPVAVPAATAVSAAVDAAAVVSEARESSPALATLTVVMPVTPTVIAPLLPEPAIPIQTGGGKSVTACGASNPDRFHPYRRLSRQSRAIQQRLREYKDARNLDELMSCLTCHSYKDRRKRLGQFGPLLDLFARPRLYENARFESYLFCPSSADEVNDKASSERRDLEMRDIPYKAEEIPNYNERRKRANTLDEIITSSDDWRDGPSRPKREKMLPSPDPTDGTTLTSRSTMATVERVRTSTLPTRL